MSSIFSVCLAYSAYDERMSNVYAIRTHTLNKIQHVKKYNLASAYNNLHRRMPANLERTGTRRMPSVPLTYICVCERVIVHLTCFNQCSF